MKPISPKSPMSRKAWNKWTRTQQILFNEVYENLMTLQKGKVFHHPKTPSLSLEQMRTVAHNAAWEAANCLRTAMVKTYMKAYIV